MVRTHWLIAVGSLLLALHAGIGSAAPPAKAKAAKIAAAKTAKISAAKTAKPATARSAKTAKAKTMKLAAAKSDAAKTTEPDTAKTAKTAVKLDVSKAAKAIDRQFAEELAAGKSPGETKPPVAPANDQIFLRRVWLDLVGDLPSPEEVTAFAIDPSPDKRAKVVERLLASPQYGQNWARYWRDVILSRRTEERALFVANPLVMYLTAELNKGTAWDSLATSFITATGDVRENGQTAIIVAQDGLTEETTAEVSRIFLGIQIQCAQCHNHVTDRWTRDQFHELAAFFPRIGLRPLVGGDRRTLMVHGDDGFGGRGKKMSGRRGAPEHFMPDLQNPTAQGTRMTPVFFLTGEKLPLGTPDAKRRETAAKLITGSPWFAKALVNRLWSEMVGQGFYEPVDDIGPDREAKAPKTLELLATNFVDSGYDLKWLLQTIAATEAYQRAGAPRPNAGEVASANCPQRMRADQLYNALTSVLELDDDGANAGRRYNGPRGMLNGPRGQFTQMFAYDPSAPRDEVSGSIPQALAMMNSPQVNGEINARNRTTMLGRLTEQIKNDEDLVVELYLRCLAREPRDTELNTCLAHVHNINNRPEAFEDLLWVLLNSTEFLHRR